MSITKKNDNKIVKRSIMILGGLLIAAGLTSYISSYLSNQDSPKIESTIVVEVPSSELNTAIEVETDKHNTEVTNKVDLIDPQDENASQQVVKTSLPSLHDSDRFFLSELNRSSLQSLFVPVDIIRNMVVFIDNFARGELVSNFSPLQKPTEQFSVIKHKDILIVNSDSYLRYDKYANAVSTIDTEKFIKLYTLLTPLIDEAYQEIGYPAGSFNQTFDKAIEHLLETPIIHYKLEVTSPSVMYQYADKNLESLPDTQKLLLRMGPYNLQMVREKLQEIQSELQRL